MTTKPEVLAMARQCNLEEAVDGVFYVTAEGFERFAALVAAAEREECAKDKVDAERFRYLQSLPFVDAQAIFWNYPTRKQRAKEIDRARSAK